MHISLTNEPSAPYHQAGDSVHVPERDTMLMTHLAILDAGEPEPGVWDKLRTNILRFFGLAEDTAPEEIVFEGPEAISHDAPTEPLLRLVTVEPRVIHPTDGFRWRRHPQLLKQPASDLAHNERDARHEAVRGLYAARAGAIEVAVSHFTRAAECPDIDLSAIPGFWQLSRTAMMTAVEAYERVDRIRDASALNARIRTMYRPRALTPVPANVTHLPEPASKISSNS